MSHAAAAKYMTKSKAFVQKWVTRYKSVKNVDDFQERGSIGKVTPKAEKILLIFFCETQH